MNHKLMLIVIGAAFAVIMNFAFVYWHIFQTQQDIAFLKKNSLQNTVIQSESAIKQEAIVISITPTTNDCPVCMEEIASIKRALTQSPAIPTSSYAFSVPAQSQGTVKEYFIPVGTGSTKSQDWIDIPATDVTINTGNYTKIKSVYFEAALQIPTSHGVVHARLYNVSDKHPVWNSEVSSEGPTPILKKSNIVVLDSGNKIYRLQMKSTIGAEALTTMSRVNIYLE